jgi:hypothetical protein
VEGVTVLIGLCALVLAASQVTTTGTPPQGQPRDPRAESVQGTGSISGRITAADTGLPIRRAIVSLPAQKRRIYTDHEGRYRFDRLPPGSYTVSAIAGPYRVDYQPQSYGGYRVDGSQPTPRPIELANGQNLESIDIALSRSGVITGTVVGSEGEPLPRMRVMALMLRSGGAPMPRGGGTTDDRGMYRIFGLPSGAYVVQVSPPPGPLHGEVEGDRTRYVETYAPGTATPEQAARVRLPRGGGEAVLDVRLGESGVYRISGLILNSRGEAGGNGSVMLARLGDLTGSTVSVSVSATGAFTLRNVPPGSYELVARTFPAPQPGRPPVSANAADQEYASLPIEVGNADLDNVLLTTRRGATVSGKIRVEGTVSNGRHPSVFVQNVGGQQVMPSPQVEVSADRFTLTNVSTPILLRGSEAGSGAVLKAVLLGGRDITDVPTAFTEQHSGQLEVILTTAAPSLEGVVTDHAGKPQAQATVLLFSDDPATWVPQSSYFRRAPLDKDGRFTLTGLREGSYFAVALGPEAGEGLDQPTRAFLESLSKVATRVVLNPGETRTVDLPLVRFEQ